MDGVKTAIIDLYNHAIVIHKRQAGLAGAHKRAVLKQKRINRCVAFCAASATANIILMHCILDMHDKKINKLNKEIEELKKSKGE